MTSFLSLLTVVVIASSCSSAPPDATQFEDGTEFDLEIIEGERSSLPECDGGAYCSNAVATLCQFEGDAEAGVCVESPNGDRLVVVSDNSTAKSTVSPSGDWLLALDFPDWRLVDADGEETPLDPRFKTLRWIDDDALVADVDGGLEFIDTDQQVLERIADPVGLDLGLRGFDLSDDGRLLLAFADDPSQIDWMERELMVYDRRSAEWATIDTGGDFINLMSQPGFGPDGSTVVAQLTDAAVLDSSVRELRYRLVSIDIATNDITVIEETYGPSGQFFAVSPDGRFVAVTGNYLLRIVDVETATVSASVRSPGGAWWLQWSYDSDFLALGFNHVAMVEGEGDAVRIGPIVDVTPGGVIESRGIFTGAGF